MTLFIGEVPYLVQVPFEAHLADGELTFTARDQWRPVNKCDHCGRFDAEPIALTTVEELLAHGWITTEENP